MTDLQTCATILTLISMLWVISLTLAIKEVDPMELWVILAIISFVAGFIMCFVTWSAYKYSLLEKCQVTSAQSIYWTEKDGNSNPIAWVNLGDRRFCKVYDERSFWVGIGNPMPYAISGVVENR